MLLVQITKFTSNLYKGFGMPSFIAGFATSGEANVTALIRYDLEKMGTLDK
jgi:hypothetical protein